ncbi:unnamed protein product, partial [Nesidiocoris tenuis]
MERRTMFVLSQLHSSETVCEMRARKQSEKRIRGFSVRKLTSRNRLIVFFIRSSPALDHTCNTRRSIVIFIVRRTLGRPVSVRISAFLFIFSNIFCVKISVRFRTATRKMLSSGFIGAIHVKLCSQVPHQDLLEAPSGSFFQDRGSRTTQRIPSAETRPAFFDQRFENLQASTPS